MAEETQVPFREQIIDMDPNCDSPTFDGGFDSVVRLYRSHLVQDIAEAALTPGSEVPSHLIAALHDLMIEAFPIATFSDTVLSSLNQDISTTLNSMKKQSSSLCCTFWHLVGRLLW
jgi:hypothetical protein